MNSTIIVDKGLIYQDQAHKCFRDLLLILESVFKSFTKRTKDEWDTGTHIESVDLSKKSAEKYNSMVKSKYLTKTNPKETIIIALTTRLSNLDRENI